MLTLQNNQDPDTLAWKEMIRLTPEERSLLHLTVMGYKPEQAAERLGVTAGEAHDTLDRLQARSGALCRRALVVRAVLEGWVDAMRV